MLSNQFIKTVAEKKSHGFGVWFVVGTAVVILGYKAFSQPILMDRAYLLYMAQTVFRGESLYEATTYGYTPLATLIAGYWMKLTVPFGINTITSSKILGIIIYGLNVGSFYLLSREVFHKNHISWLSTTLFAGLSFLAVWSGTGAEPKHFVLLFTILGLIFLIRRKWFWVGLTFGLATMCWHVAMVHFFVVIPILPWRRIIELRNAIVYAFIGAIVAFIPVIIYLWVTESWAYFWNQAVLRKLLYEGSEVGENPFRWMIKAWFPSYTGDLLHFIAGFSGFFLLLSRVLIKSKGSEKVFSFHKNAIAPLIAITITWALLNFIEFQAPPDNVTLLPSIIVFGSYFISECLVKIKRRVFSLSLISILLIYNFFDMIIYTPPFTLKEQSVIISEIKENYSANPFTFSFEEFYSVTEENLPTKYIRHEKYEDILIDRIYNEKEVVYDAIDKSEYLIVRSEKTDNSKCYDLLRSLASQVGYKTNHLKKNAKGIGETYLSKLDLTPIDTFHIKADKLLLTGKFYKIHTYTIFKRNSSE